MASIKQSLRKIYTALGGATSNSKTITGLLDDISTVASTEGGGGVEIVNLTLQGSGSSSTIESMDKTRDELVNAHNNGKLVVAQTSIHTSGGQNPISLMLCYTDYAGGAFTGSGIISLWENNASKKFYISVSIMPNSNFLNIQEIKEATE